MTTFAVHVPRETRRDEGVVDEETATREHGHERQEHAPYTQRAGG
jgi:hypothetical protein